MENFERGLKIVVFGCDNSGKTTLCNDIKRYYNQFEIAKSIGANKTAKEYIDFMETNLNSKQNIIFDRFPLIEECVCGTVLRGKNLFEDVMNGFEGRSLLSLVDLFVFCYPGLFCVTNWGDREQMEGVKENVLGLIDGYNVFAYWLNDNGFRICEYNYNNVSDGNYPEQIVKLSKLNRTEEA